MSLSKNDSKYIRSLGLKKYRQKYNKFTVEGEKMVLEVLQQSRFQVDALYALPTWAERHADLLASTQLTPTYVNEIQLAQISQLTTPNQVLAVVEMPAALPWPVPTTPGWFLYLDGIQDPANLGAILRVADWFGWPAVVLGPGTVDPYNAKVIQASMGAFLRVHWREGNLPQLRSDYPDLPCWGAAMNGQNVFTQPLPPAGVLVIGREGSGIQPTTDALLDGRLAIPAPAHGGAESLNAAVATGILCAVISHGHYSLHVG